MFLGPIKVSLQYILTRILYFTENQTIFEKIAETMADEQDNTNAQVQETVEGLRTQLTAMQAAIEGQTSSSLFRPKTFSGLGYDDVTDFISKFERYCKFYNWSNAKRLAAISLLFEGPALAWYQTLADETKNNYNNLIDALRGRFASASAQFLQRQELNERKQGDRENLSSYTEDIIRKCSRLGLTDVDRMNHFISGLNHDLKSHVILNRPQSFEEAESLARLKESVNQSKTTSSRMHLPSERTNRDNPTAGSYSASQDQQQQRITELEGQVQLLMAAVSRPKQPGVAAITQSYPQSTTDVNAIKSEIIAAVRDEIRKENQQSNHLTGQRENPGTENGRNRYNRRDSRGRNLRTTDGQPICNNCRRVGHVARYCRESGMSSFPSYSTHSQFNPPPVADKGGYPYPPYAPIPPPMPEFHQQSFALLNDQGPSSRGHGGSH